MAYRVLEVTLHSARDLKNVNFISRMEVYAVVTISGDPLTRQCTPSDPYGGRHPAWNATLRFTVPPTAAGAAGCLHVLLRAERSLGDRDIGEVIIPLAEILSGTGGPYDLGSRPPQFASYQVRKVHRSEPRGVLHLSYRLGPIISPQPPATVFAYPAPQFDPPPSPPYVPPPPEAYLRKPAPPSPPVAKPPPPTPPLAKPPPPTPPPPRAAGQVGLPAKGKNLEFEMGLGAGLVGGAIGGMLASDMVSDAAVYDAGYRDGLADRGRAVY
ncbi:hypothetical protein E2562_020464 [Oryza meyeriana var. granulata]|uniref:C2 domain-containing protein n=1 Tax=Oryza meyeriana var. granulata TaxID=110450 RepID=A0A6G1D5U8_9ORYZ|nr:hypothetical protein E2562_020464 [Oryza meyeriana var. granulata]